jgi:surface antigen
MRLIQRLLVGLTAVMALMTLVASPASASGDDYPWRTSTTNSLDRWGFTQRQCVSFVAWREAQAGREMNNAEQHWGSALNWDEAAARLGVRIGTRPVVGAIAHWNAGERSPWWANGSSTANGYIQAGAYGHVGFVKQVNSDGSALVEQYNLSGNRSYSLTRVKAPRYLYDGVAGYPEARRA